MIKRKTVTKRDVDEAKEIILSHQLCDLYCDYSCSGEAMVMVSAYEDLEKHVLDLRMGKCRCTPTGPHSTEVDSGEFEEAHETHCPEMAEKLHRGYCDRIKELLVLTKRLWVMTGDKRPGGFHGTCYCCEKLDEVRKNLSEEPTNG